MRKNIKFLPILVCLLLALSSCAVSPTNSNPVKITSPSVTEPQVTADTATPTEQSIETKQYRLFWENGKSYMEFSTAAPATGNGFLVALEHPRFSSVYEMKQGILSGDFSDAELCALRAYTPSNINTVEICNIHSLYEATLPAGIEIEHIELYGKEYTFEFDGGNISYITQETFEYEVERTYNGSALSDSISITSIEAIADRNAEVMRYNYGGSEIERVRYTNETSNGMQYILEVYKDGVVSRLCILGTLGNAYYKVNYVENLTQRPSIEWLSAFGLREYVETEVS